jgi:hypothetical protein
MVDKEWNTARMDMADFDAIEQKLESLSIETHARHSKL